MKEKLLNKKIIYIASVIVIILGIIVTCIWKTNVTLLDTNHTRIDIYIGKDYNKEEIEQIAKDTLGTKKIIFQEIETFNDSIAIHVKQANTEQIEALKSNIAQKYEIEDTENLIKITNIGNVRIRDMIEPYIVPIIIATIIISIYIGIRYFKLGIVKQVLILLLRLLVSEALLLSIIEITRIPVGTYTILLAILVYIVVIIFTIIGYENQLNIAKDKKKQK